jgi:mono/diheme cytochrome c family protein
MIRLNQAGTLRRLRLAAVASMLAMGAWTAFAQDAAPTAALIEKGRQLAVAADCAACHTAYEGQPFAGGNAIASPLGAIYASNITPSRTHGIGAYSLADFVRAVREGVTPDGTHLYPAMPYPSYTQVTDADMAALYAYFMHGVRPVEQAAPETHLPFPFNVRASMVVWNALFLKPQRFEPDASRTAEWNRGAYLTGALAHCSACHTPRNGLMAEDGGSFLAGGSVGAWFAPNISSDPHVGIGDWSTADLVRYLRTGNVPGKAQAAGPMAEAIEHSLQHLPESDLQAIAVYLKETPPSPGAVAKGVVKTSLPRDVRGQASDDEASQRGSGAQADPGWRLFSANCAHCHQVGGAGNEAYPSLFHNSATGAARADNLIATILYGVRRTVDGHPVAMPAFGDAAAFNDRLSDQEIADVSNYVLNRFGDADVRVKASDVRTARHGGPTPLLAHLASFSLPALGVIALIAIALLVRRQLARKSPMEAMHVQ